MKKTILFVLLALFVSSISFGQYYGTVYYNLNATATPYVTIDGVASTTNTITYNGSGVDVTDDGNALALSQGASATAIAQNNGHGAILKTGHTISFKVAGKAKISFIICMYSQDGTYYFADESGTIVDSLAARNSAKDGDTVSFTYKGTAQTLTATLTSAGTNYLHGIIIENIETLPSLDGKVQVWDFGAEQFAGADTINMLTNDSINAWYTGMTLTSDSTGMNLPATFTTGGLTWVGKASSDRLRTINKNLIRYDSKYNGVYTGYLYANGAVTVTNSLPGNRYFSLKLEEQDEISIVDMGNSNDAKVTLVYESDPTLQNEYKVATKGTATQVDFIATQAGTYRIYDAKDKLSVFRITRKNADYVTVSGTVDESNISLDISGYGVVFTNQDADISWTAIVSNGTYSIDIPAGHTYDLSLSGANGVVITSTDSIILTEATTFDLTILQVTLNKVTGTVTGLGDNIEDLTLVYNPDADLNKIYVPQPVISMSTPTPTYSVLLESECQYTIEAVGVNDYELVSDTLTIHGNDTVFNIAFTAKPVYDITIETVGLTDAQKDSLKLTFTNLYEDGYAYSFDSLTGIQLRNGTYTVDYTGLDDFPVELALTSNLTVDSAATSKTLTFEPVTIWSFDDYAVSGDAYKGLLFTGSVSSEVTKGHIALQNDATLKVPVSVGDKMRLSYYNSAKLAINGEDTAYTASGSTSTVEYIDYVYTADTNGYINIAVVDSIKSYITEIEVYPVVAYADTIYVGTDKEYTTINAALDAIAAMDRPNDERVVVMIDPGNYEEMIVISVPNVTFTNAASEPSIDILNKGVDIDENAVRITSYYGHGYNYYSMGNDQKWNADVLRVNKENGYVSYENAGSGTTNGSYWNATMVVSANGFEANFIIIENSYNQYISQKESEDVVVEWETGGKGTRPTDAGNTDVQDKTYVERAAAIAVTSDKIILNKCRVIGRQDSFYGGKSSRVVVYKGDMMGATDYIFGGMVAVFYQSNLVMNTSENSNDICYITAAQQESGRGYLMYECNIMSPEPVVETASTKLSKPGYFGRPWQANTSEVVFYNTDIDSTNFSGTAESLIEPAGWLSTLSGESPYMYEYGTLEASGEDNSASRVSWATLLSSPTLTDGTEITCFNFTKGSDDWDPIPGLIAGDTIMITIDPVVIDTTVVIDTIPTDTIPTDTTPTDTTPTDTTIISVNTVDQIKVYANHNQVYVKNISTETQIYIYNINGALVAKKETMSDITFTLEKGFYIIKLMAESEQKAVKVISQ